MRVVKNGSVTRATVAASMPRPLSFTVIVSVSACRSSSMVRLDARRTGLDRVLQDVENVQGKLAHLTVPRSY